MGMGDQHRVLFICHGNICRSTMAEFVLREYAERAGCGDDYVIDSAATSLEEIGNPPHPGTVRKLRQEGIPVGRHHARRFRSDEYDDWDLIVYMDDENLWGLRRLHRDDPAGKYVKLLSFVEGAPGRDAPDVADPWYSGDFDATFRDVSRGCAALLRRLSGGRAGAGASANAGGRAGANEGERTDADAGSSRDARNSPTQGRTTR